MKANIDFLKGYINDAAWEIVLNIESNEAGSRFAAYCVTIECISARDTERLDRNTDVEGDAMYLAAGLCGEEFWSAFVNQIQRCIESDLADKDLTERQAKALWQLLQTATAPSVQGKD